MRGEALLDEAVHVLSARIGDQFRLPFDVGQHRAQPGGDLLLLGIGEDASGGERVDPRQAALDVDCQ